MRNRPLTVPLAPLWIKTGYNLAERGRSFYNVN